MSKVLLALKSYVEKFPGHHVTRVSVEFLGTAASEIERLRTENEQMKDAVKKDLSDRMVAAGMVPLDAVTKTEWLGKYAAHAAMVDMDFFAIWIERKAKEYATMNAAHQSGAHVMDDDICDFVIGKSSAFSEVLANLRAAKAGGQP